MEKRNLSAIRLASQQLTGEKPASPLDVVNRMGAMQAQDLKMAMWAVGIRMDTPIESGVKAALDDGEILRTHLLRPTWHLVTAQDIYWMLELTAPQIRASLRSRHKQLEITPAVINKSNDVIVSALSKGKHLTREEVVQELKDAGFTLKDNRAAHLLMLAELDGLIGSGKFIKDKPTYALLEERVPKTKPIDRKEALVRLATTYFTSRGPATLEDFVWWSGLPVKEAQMALEMIRKDFLTEEIDSKVYWLTPQSSFHREDKKSAFFLPAYDEFLIGYKNREAAITIGNFKKAVSNNGIFWPVIVLDGEVKGKWKRTIKNNEVKIEIEWFQVPNGYSQKHLSTAASRYGDFLRRKTEFLSEVTTN